MPEAPFPAVIGSETELRTLYRAPSALVEAKKVERIDPIARQFIEAAPFCLLATADSGGRCDVSPRGGPPGFARVLDERRLVLPDLNGNNLLDSLTNIVANPNVGLLFVHPGKDETLRLEGRAWLTTADDILGLWDDELRRPKVAVAVEARTVYIHCAKSFRRGRVWDPGSWLELAAAPDAADVVVDQTGMEATAQQVRDALAAGYEADLAYDRPE